MTLRMPRPFTHKNGTFFLNVRVPSDLAKRMRGSRVALPVAGDLVTVAVTDKVFLSLRTKCPNEARGRFTLAHAALVRYWDAQRAGPKPLTHKQLVALAGEAYCRSADKIEADPDYGPHVFFREKRMMEEAIHAWRFGEDGQGEDIGEADARFFAAIERPYGPQLLALETGRDLDTPYAKCTCAEALEDIFGTDADRVCAEHGLVLDDETRRKLMIEVGRAMDKFGAKLKANAHGDFSVDHRKEFPAFIPPTPAPSRDDRPASRKALSKVVEDWRRFSADKLGQATIRRYGPSLASFVRFSKDADIRLVTSKDVRSWAEHRRDKDGVSPFTVNRNDLVALSTIFSFAAGPDGGELRADNPVRGVKLALPKKRQLREKTFLANEIRAVLMLARSVQPNPKTPRLASARRWVPWVCAYSGARVQEVCWLSKTDIWNEGGIFAMRFPMTKDGMARTIPIHDALIREGLLDFWKNASDGPLFTGDRPPKPGVTRPPAEQRASDLAAWISANIELDEVLSPNHAWRHTFITRAEGAGISKRMANALAGHNRRRDASDASMHMKQVSASRSDRGAMQYREKNFLASSCQTNGRLWVSCFVAITHGFAVVQGMALEVNSVP